MAGAQGGGSNQTLAPGQIPDWVTQASGANGGALAGLYNGGNPITSASSATQLGSTTVTPASVGPPPATYMDSSGNLTAASTNASGIPGLTLNSTPPDLTEFYKNAGYMDMNSAAARPEIATGPVEQPKLKWAKTFHPGARSGGGTMGTGQPMVGVNGVQTAAQWANGPPPPGSQQYNEVYGTGGGGGKATKGHWVGGEAGGAGLDSGWNTGGAQAVGAPPAAAAAAGAPTAGAPSKAPGGGQYTNAQLQNFVRAAAGGNPYGGFTDPGNPNQGDYHKLGGPGTALGLGNMSPQQIAQMQDIARKQLGQSVYDKFFGSGTQQAAVKRAAQNAWLQGQAMSSTIR